jgi:hypothetical protein
MEMETIAINKIYPVQIWLATIIIAPILLSIVNLIEDHNYFNNSDNFLVIILFIGYGLFFSLPAFVIFFIAFKILIRNPSSPLLIKIITDLISIGCLIITFLLIEGSMIFLGSIYYSASIIISSLFFKIYKSNKSVK